MTEVTNKLNIDPSPLVTHLVQITDKMKLDLQQVNNRMNVLEQKVAYNAEEIILDFSKDERCMGFEEFHAFHPNERLLQIFLLYFSIKLTGVFVCISLNNLFSVSSSSFFTAL